MQLPELAPPPLAPLWDRVLRARALPPDLDVELLYVAIRDRLIHPEWEVRLHALRVLADLLPLSGNALSFPFDQVVDNLGHNSPNVRKAALDALKVFSSHCEDPECAARAILDKCSYNNIRPHSADIDVKVNVVTGLILSISSVMAILKRRHPHLDTFPIFQVLGEKLFDHVHRDAALRSLIKLRRVCGPRDYMTSLSRLDFKVQDRFRFLCEKYDEDSLDVHYPPRKTNYRHNNNELAYMNKEFNSPITTPLRLSTDSSSEDSYSRVPLYGSNFGKVIIETEFKFDSDTAITMTVLEENDSESERNTYSDCDSSDRNMLKYSDEESEDPDVVVKRVRFGGESVKIRTPDSDNLLTSEDDRRTNELKQDNLEQVSRPVTPVIVDKMNEIKREALEREASSKAVKKSGIPLPVLAKPITNGNIAKEELQKKKVKIKSKSLSELYDYFRSKNDCAESGGKEELQLALAPEPPGSDMKLPSPVEAHREVEVLHNLQRSPSVSPRRRQARVELDEDGFIQNILASSPAGDPDLLSPQAPSPMRAQYAWEELGVVPAHVADQLHCTENWIATVRAADQLHSSLLETSAVRKVEPAARSLVEHMWALSDAVPSAHAPAEGAVCALFRGASNTCARELLPVLVARLAREPPPAALPHALLQRLALHNLVDLIFDPSMIGESEDSVVLESRQLAAALCVSRAAGPAAVLAAVRRRLAGTRRADAFCLKLRERLNRPIKQVKATHFSRSSHLPVPVRRRARSTPPPAAPPPPRRLRPLPDSAPLMGVSQLGKDVLFNPLSPIPLSDKDSSALTADSDKTIEKPPPDENKSVQDIVIETDDVDIPATDEEPPPSPPHSPSINVEDYSEKSNASLHRAASQNSRVSESNSASNELGSKQSLTTEWESPEKISSGRKSSQSKTSTPAKKSISGSSSPTKSGKISPEPTSDAYEHPACCERDVRNALAECIVPVKHEDWEVIVNRLAEMERLASDPSARAPAASWRAVTRSAAGHVRSLRSRVARAACSALGALYDHRGRALDPELEESVMALLDRCADVNRFLRADAASALVRTACGTNSARAAVALARRGASHRAGPVRAAAALALAKLVQRHGASRTLDFPSEPRTVLLRASGELLGDANADTRLHARHLCYALAEDMRFRPMLKEALQLTRYKAIEKYLDKLR